MKKYMSQIYLLILVLGVSLTLLEAAYLETGAREEADVFAEDAEAPLTRQDATNADTFRQAAETPKAPKVSPKASKILGLTPEESANLKAYKVLGRKTGEVDQATRDATELGDLQTSLETDSANQQAKFAQATKNDATMNDLRLKIQEAEESSKTGSLSPKENLALQSNRKTLAQMKVDRLQSQIKEMKSTISGLKEQKSFKLNDYEARTLSPDSITEIYDGHITNQETILTEMQDELTQAKKAVTTAKKAETQAQKAVKIANKQR